MFPLSAVDDSAFAGAIFWRRERGVGELNKK